MGHNRLGRLARTRRWDQVVDLLDRGGSSATVAAAAMRAAQSSLQDAARDRMFNRAFWLLLQIPDCARQDDFANALQELGLDVPSEPSIFDVTSALSGSLRRERLASGAHSDFGEMAESAANEVFVDLISGETGALFGTSPGDVKRIFKGYSSGSGFGRLSRAFMARFLDRYLSFYLSRVLSTQVGVDARFANPTEHTEFQEALQLHCMQAARIVEDFSGGWLGKRRFVQGEVPERDVPAFLNTALTKIGKELGRP